MADRRNPRRGGGRPHQDQQQLPIVEVEGLRWTASGDVFANWNGKALFLRGALPGEHLRVQITELKKDFARGKVIQVLQASPSRIKPECPHYGSCGGCDLQHLKSTEHLEAKRAMLNDTLRRQGGFTQVWIDANVRPIESGEAWAYRGRVRIHGNGQGQWGFLGSATHSIVPIDDCYVMEDAMAQFLSHPDRKVPIGEWKLQTNGSQVVIQESGKDLQIPIASKWLWANADVFFQSNREMLTRLVENELRDLQGQLAVDLFSGVGTFAAFLEDHFERVIAVERDPECLRLAELNCPKTEFFTGAAEDWAKEYPDLQPDLLIVDPPRTGLPAELLPILNDWNPKKWLYVSCDPVTMSRDLKRLGEMGWTIDLIRPYDFYPQTKHLECVVWLRRESGNTP